MKNVIHHLLLLLQGKNEPIDYFIMFETIDILICCFQTQNVDKASDRKEETESLNEESIAK